MRQKLRLLFLCTGNACRSQMAEGWTRALRGDLIEVYSAGVEPHDLDPRAIAVMAEAGVDISHQTSKPIDEFLEIPLDYVITVCDNARESCPFFPGNTIRIHAGFEDPPRLAKEAAMNGASEEEQLCYYREVRDQIRRFVETLPDSITL